LFGQLRLAAAALAFGPDVEPAALLRRVLTGGDLPCPPDAFAFVEALVEDIVLAEIAFAPVAPAVFGGVAPAQHERADPVAAFSRDGAVAKGQTQFHQVPPRNERLQEEAGPRAAREAGIGFDICSLWIAHDEFS